MMVIMVGTLSLAYAIDDPAGGVTVVGTSGQLTTSTAGNATAQGGNVTYVNVSATSTTSKWQGFYGNVTGTLQLGSGSNVFYDFGNVVFNTIFATTATNFDWANLAATTAAEIDTTWNLAAGTDNTTSVFTSTATIASIGSVPSTTINNNFTTGIMEDGGDADKGDYAFAGTINSTGALGFDGNSYQYEILVPVNSTDNDVYNFYLSLE